MSSAHVENVNGGHATGYEAHRLHTNDMEIGVTDAVQRHVQRNVVPPKPVSQRKLDFEHARPRWMREMAAEALGVFFYVCLCHASICSHASRVSLNPGPSHTHPSATRSELMCLSVPRSIPVLLHKPRFS